MIDKEDIKKLLEKLTSFNAKEIKTIKGEAWHLVVQYPLSDSTMGVYNSLHAVMEADGTIVVSKYRAMDYPKGTQLEAIKKELISEIVEPTRRLKELRN